MLLYYRECLGVVYPEYVGTRLRERGEWDVNEKRASGSLYVSISEVEIDRLVDLASEVPRKVIPTARLILAQVLHIDSYDELIWAIRSKDA